MFTNNYLNLKTNKAAQRAIAWCLIALMLFGLVPNFGVNTVQAAESTPAVNLSDLIDKNGGAVTIPVNESAVGPKIVSHNSPGGTAGYLAEYNTSGVHGYGYCMQHWKGAGNGMNIKLNDAKKANGMLANVFYMGFTDDSHAAKTQFVTDLATLADKITQEAGKGNVLSPDWATWLHSLPDDKANEYWRKATQIAVWMATDTASGKPNMVLENQLVYKDGTVKSAYSNLEGDGFDYIKNSNNSSAEAQHVLKAAKALYLVSSYFSAKGFDITQREAKMVTYPIQRSELRDYYSGDTIDFKNAGPIPGKGNIVKAFEDGCTAIVEKDGFYEIYYMTVSQTQFGGTMRISIADTSQNVPAGTVLKGLTKEDCMALGIDEDYAFPDKSGQQIELIMKKENIAPANNTDNGFGIINLPMDGNYDESRKINYPCYYKLCIPTSSVSEGDTTPVSIDIETQCTSLYKYDLYKGENNNSNMQDFALGDTVAADTNHNAVVWAGAESVIVPVLEKKSSDGSVLSGVTFKFDGPTSTSLTTDSSGKIFAQWTDSSASNYLAPGSYTVTETSVPAGYKKDPSSKTITLNADGSTSGTLTFTNTTDPHNPDGVIKKISTSGIGLAGAVFEFTSTSGAGGGTYTSDSEGIVPVQWTDKNKPNYIAPGTYLVKETVPPPGYNLDSGGAQQITLYADGKVSGQLTFVDSKKPSLLVYKSDENGNPLPGAVFSIWKDGQAMGTTEPTGANGYAEIENVENGYYEFQEYSAPAGYLLSTEKKGINVDINNIVSEMAVNVVSFKNYKTITIHILKQDDSGNGLPGAVIELKIDGRDAGRYTTGTDGSVDVNYDQIKGYLDMSRDTWTVEAREVTPPEGYLLNDTNWQTIEMTRGQDPVPFVFTDSKYPRIEIVKLENGTTTGLPGAVFEVAIDGTSIGTDFTSGAGGKIVINYDKYSRFLGDGVNQADKVWDVAVREITAPDGYLIDNDDWQHAQLKLGQTLAPFTFTDSKYPDIKIIKLDRETGDPLPNTSFRIQIDGTSFIAEKKTDEKGEIVITYAEFGHFLTEAGDKDRDSWTITVTELEPTQFYNKDKQQTSGDYTQTQQLKHGQALSVFEFKDTHYRDIKVFKRDSETNWLLKGATFRLHCVAAENKDAGNITDRELTTDEKGYVIFENIPNGTYELTEIAAPFGYDNNSEKKTVIVTSDNDRVIEFEFKNAPKSGLLIRKIDSVTKQPLANVEFRITPLAPLDSPSWTAVTDDNGLIVKENLPAGTYRIEEITTVDGYVLNDKAQLIEINKFSLRVK